MGESSYKKYSGRSRSENKFFVIIFFFTEKEDDIWGLRLFTYYSHGNITIIPRITCGLFRHYLSFDSVKKIFTKDITYNYY